MQTHIKVAHLKDFYEQKLAVDIII